MSDPRPRDIIREALDLVADPDPSDALRQLLDAAAQDDLTLAASVRGNLPLLAFGLMSLGNIIEEIQKKRPKGRPRKNPDFDIDCRRAYMCWHAIRFVKQPETSNRDAIKFTSFLEAKADIPDSERLFSTSVKQETLEESVSRGKRKLGFTGPWKSKDCEDMFADS